MYTRDKFDSDLKAIPAHPLFAVICIDAESIIIIMLPFCSVLHSVDVCARACVYRLWRTPCEYSANATECPVRAK